MCVAETFSAVTQHDHQGLGEPEGGPGPSLTRRSFFRAGAAAGAGVALAAALPRPAWAAGPAPAEAGTALSGKSLVDLTHVLRDSTPVFPGFANPKRVTLSTVGTGGFYAQQWTFPEHAGTHLDVPAHFAEGGRHVTDFSLEEFVMPAVVVDISARAGSDADTTVTVEDLQDTEAATGRLPDGGAVLMYSGWDARAGDEAQMRNIGSDGLMHTPGWSPQAIDWLLSNRNVRCIGSDTLTLDAGNSLEFPVHKTWLPEDRIGLEVVANLGRVPRSGWTLVIAVVPFEEGSGGPARVFAIVR